VNIDPQSLRAVVYQPWYPGTPAVPGPDERIHIFGTGTDGNVYHRWYIAGKWETWENLGQP
jgi:Repeat of unknown function (DUF346)